MSKMKPLIAYIEEARETVGKLPFTRQQFRFFLKAVADYEDEDPVYVAIENAVTRQYGEKAWRGFLGWCEGSHYDSNPDDLYDILINLPKDRIARILGAGSYGAAVEMTNGKVCKLYHKNTPMEPQDRKFFAYCMKTKSNVFPVVYKFGENYVVMEKLKMNTPKCKLYDEYFRIGTKKVFGGKTIEDLAKQSIKKDKKVESTIAGLDAEAKEIFDWAVEALTRLKEAVGWDSFSDIRLPNIGERGDGSIIWFDI